MHAGKLILLVTDIPDHAATYGRALVERGFRVHLVRTGRDALQLVAVTAPPCAVIDLRLPDMSGWELCRDLRRSEEGRGMRLVVLTPDLSRACAEDSTRAGCDAWLSHPTVAEDLVRTIERVLDRDATAPRSPDEAIVGLVECAACGSDQVRPTLRISPVQYYRCRSCSFCWRVELLEPSRQPR